MRPMFRPGLIGRGDEARAVARFVERVPNGPVALAIEGEPGIGKTTLWSEAVRAAEERDCRVLRARPAESEADLSYAALGDLVGDAFDEVSVELPGPQRHALEVALLRRESTAAADPRTTASALVSVLTALAAERPLVVAVDDAQWLDRASERALAFACRRLPSGLGLLVAHRSAATGEAPLGLDRALAAEALERLVLGPLSLAALHHVVHREVGVELTRPALVRIEAVSGGNPFYALEIARALGRDGGERRAGEPLPLPQSLHGLVDARLRRLSASAQSVALAVAALSHPTAAGVAAALAEEGDTTAALLEAEEAGVLVWEGERLRFSHPLLASAVYASAPAGRRRQLHERLAHVVSDPEERARHLARSGTQPEEATAAEIEQAAALADRRGAPEAAAELYEAACRLTPEGQPDELARRILGAANALGTAGDLGGAWSLANRALETARAGPLRARVLLLLGSLASYTETTEARVGYHERALAEAGEDRALRVEILLSLVEEIGVDPQRALRRAEEAIELVRGRDEPSLLAQALMNAFIAGVLLGRGARHDLLEEALALEAAAGGRRLIYPLLWYHWVDDLEATRARHLLQQELCREHGDAVGAAEIVEFLAITEFRAGNWDEAERALEAACATLEQVGLRGPLTASFADRSLIDAHRGRLERARTTLTHILETVEPLEVLWRAVCRSPLGFVQFCAGEYEAADRTWTQMRHEADLVGWKDFMEDRSEPDHIEALLALGEIERARGLLEHLEWRGATLPRPWIDATLPRARALILAGEGDLEAGLAELDAAPPVSALPFERARLLLAKGRLERRSNRKLLAKESLVAALRIFQELGSPPWAERAQSEIRRLGLRQRPPGELTAGERRIAELAAAGLTNRQVAEAAFVSPKTVEANLARVYRKLGIRSRAELGARMSVRARDAEAQT